VISLAALSTFSREGVDRIRRSIGGSFGSHRCEQFPPSRAPLPPPVIIGKDGVDGDLAVQRPQRLTAWRQRDARQDRSPYEIA
jgi:hypothetical protein